MTDVANGSASTNTNTGTLYPDGGGDYEQWDDGSDNDVNETGTPDCSSSDSLIENSNGDRESVDLDLSSIPNGATITSVDITSWDRPDSNTSSGAGGTYQTFARLNNTNTDSGANIATVVTGGNSAPAPRGAPRTST